ncbi:protein phosphatase 1 regulatory subunit 1C [Menidia menidia]
MEPRQSEEDPVRRPPAAGQLDPQASEHIRRRRPTPATLQIYRQPGTDVGDQHNAGGETQGPDASQRKQSAFAPPTMKDLQGAGLPETDSELSPITAQLYAASQWANHNGPEEANGNEACLLLANQERGGPEDPSCCHIKDDSSPDSVSR